MATRNVASTHAEVLYSLRSQEERLFQRGILGKTTESIRCLLYRSLHELQFEESVRRVLNFHLLLFAAYR